jgi:hypothetical protein
MGYYSQVAYAVVFKSTKDRDKILSRITPEQQKIVRDEATIEEDRILFHGEGKWYSTRLTGTGGFEDVDSHEALLAAAEEAYQGLADDFPEPIPSMGVFMRLGQDMDDFECNFWGDDVKGIDDEWYELVHVRRELVVGWE